MKVKYLVLMFAAAGLPLQAQGYLCAVGGGSENYGSWSDESYRWMVEKSGKGPTLILHYSEGSTWLEKYFLSFGAGSAASLVVPSRTMANDSAVYRTIKKARHIFLRGGDQYRYYQLWRNTLTEQAIRETYQSGGVIGGTSAGLAVLGGVDYIAQRNSAVSAQALQNPHHADITLAEDFLPFLPQVLLDSHFTRRGRLGRLLAFIANWNTTHSTDIIGIGMDEHTALCVAPDGEATVSGAGAAFIVHRTPASQVTCAPGKPLSFTDWTLHSLTAGFRYHLYSRTVTGIPASASLSHPVHVASDSARAVIRIDGTNAPVQATAAMRWLAQEADGAKILVIQKSANSTAPILHTELGCTQVVTITMDPARIDADDQGLATQIRDSDHIIVAGLNTDETLQQFQPHSQVGEALAEKCAQKQARILLQGSMALAWSERLMVNTESTTYALQDGQLRSGMGLNLLNGACVVSEAFKEDDYLENRLGGFFWNFVASPNRLAVLTDSDADWYLQSHRIKNHARTGILILDGAHITYSDTSRFRYMGSPKPRQTAACANARLHCLANDERLSFDMMSRQIDIATVIPKTAMAIPGAWQIRAHPNPAKQVLWLESAMPAGEKEIRIFDSVGRQVAEWSAMYAGSPWYFDLRGLHLASGRYFILIGDTRQRFTGSFSLIK